MKERPILFSAAMVRAILNGSKTQTRRVVNPQPFTAPLKENEYYVTEHEWKSNKLRYGKLPYGQPGDLLWVRESFYQYGHWEPVAGKLTKRGRQKWAFVPDLEEITFDSSAVPDGSWRLGRHNVGFEIPAWHKRLARFMPRKFSRITLEIVSVRVERLQDISSSDAIAEGIPVTKGSGLIEGEDCYGMTTNSGYMRGPAGAVAAYQDLWQSINGPGSWEANPFVWVVEFKQITP